MRMVYFSQGDREDFFKECYLNRHLSDKKEPAT